jgi:hypothetical protein
MPRQDAAAMFKNKYLSILLNLLLIYPLFLTGAPSNGVLCLAGVEHIALEPAHNGSHSISPGWMFERETVPSAFLRTMHEIRSNSCIDVPLLTTISTSRTCSRDQGAHCLRILVSFPIKTTQPDTLYGDINPEVPLVVTSTHRSLRTTVLLV